MKTLVLFCFLLSHLENIFCESDAPIEEIKAADFPAFVQDNPRVLVLFYDPTNPPSEDVFILFEEYTAPTGFAGDLKVAESTDIALANKYGLTQFPGALFYRENSPVPYDGELNDEELSDWLIRAQEVATQELHDLTFEHQTQAITGSTTGDWLVVFYKESCSQSLPVFETVAVRLKGKANVAKVNMDKNPKLVSRFSLTKCPSTIYFRQGTMYRYDLDKYSVKILLSFVQACDKATESIALFIKKHLHGPNGKLILGVAGGVGGLVFLILIVCCCCCRGKSDKLKSQ